MQVLPCQVPQRDVRIALCPDCHECIVIPPDHDDSYVENALDDDGNCGNCRSSPLMVGTLKIEGMLHP